MYTFCPTARQTPNCGNILTYILDIFLAGHGFIDERGQAFNSCDVVLRHLSLSIAGRRRVSSSRPRRDCHTVLAGLADHLIGLEQEGCGNGQVEGLGRLQIDDEL
jgi:hypothetical protein